MTQATTIGTKHYRNRFAEAIPDEHFREAQSWWLSSIGLGTYLGHFDEETDENYRQAVARAIELGCNVIDSASNYRFQRSERNIGDALEKLFQSGQFAREEIVICTKGGYIPFDTQPPTSNAEARKYFETTFIEPGIATAGEIVGGSHCMTPRYLEHQLNQSLRNLKLETIDVYYIHNPESQLGAVSRAEFNQRIHAAFEFLEGRVAAGQIGFYGAATWNGFRIPPQAREHLNLGELENIAAEVGGSEHHFRFIQLPYNLAMPEALTQGTQPMGDELLSTLDAALNLDITVVCSASLYQAKLAHGLPAFVAGALRGATSDAQRAIQFVRSTPSVTTALIGMSQTRHVEENLQLARLAPAATEDWLKLFTQTEE